VGRLTAPALIACTRPTSGSGNRVRAVLGCQILAIRAAAWPTGRAFSPRITDLWSYTEGSAIPRLLSTALSPVFPYEGEAHQDSSGPERRPFIRQVRTGGELRLPAGVPSWRDVLRALPPVPQITAMVQQFFAEHLAGRPSWVFRSALMLFGHEKTQLASPVEWYLGRMQDVLKHDPDVHFVSCDVLEVFARVVAAVPNCHGLTDKGAYDSVPAAQAAVADSIYSLAPVTCWARTSPVSSTWQSISPAIVWYWRRATMNHRRRSTSDQRGWQSIPRRRPGAADHGPCGLDHPPVASLPSGLMVGAVRTCRR
jgi:hypothetical protein